MLNNNVMHWVFFEFWGSEVITFSTRPVDSRACKYLTSPWSTADRCRYRIGFPCMISFTIGGLKGNSRDAPTLRTQPTCSVQVPNLNVISIGTVPRSFHIQSVKGQGQIVTPESPERPLTVLVVLVGARIVVAGDDSCSSVVRSAARCCEDNRGFYG